MWCWWALELWAECLSDWTWRHQCRQQRKLRVQKQIQTLNQHAVFNGSWALWSLSDICCDVSLSCAFRWRAANYSQFYGMTLDEGIRYRLGTQRPAKTIMNMNEIQVHGSFLSSDTIFEIQTGISRYFEKVIKSAMAFQLLLTFHLWLRGWISLKGLVEYHVSWLSWVYLLMFWFPQLCQGF